MSELGFEPSMLTLYSSPDFSFLISKVVNYIISQAPPSFPKLNDPDLGQTLILIFVRSSLVSLFLEVVVDIIVTHSVFEICDLVIRIYSTEVFQ